MGILDRRLKGPQVSRISRLDWPSKPIRKIRYAKGFPEHYLLAAVYFVTFLNGFRLLIAFLD